MSRAGQETRPRNYSLIDTIFFLFFFNFYFFSLTLTPHLDRSLFFVRLFFCLKTFANLRFTLESGIDTHKVIEIVSRSVIIAPMRDTTNILDASSRFNVFINHLSVPSASSRFLVLPVVLFFARPRLSVLPLRFPVLSPSKMFHLSTAVSGMPNFLTERLVLYRETLLSMTTRKRVEGKLDRQTERRARSEREARSEIRSPIAARSTKGNQRSHR